MIPRATPDGGQRAGTAGLTSVLYQPRVIRIAEHFGVGGAAFLFFWMTSLQAHRLTPKLFDKNDLIFAADTYDTVDAIRNLTLQWDMQKHLLFSPITHGIYAVVGRLSHCAPDSCIPLTLAVCAAFNIVACYALLRAVARTRWNALLFTGFYSLTFANLVFFSIPETYVVSAAGILLVFRALLTEDACTPFGALSLGAGIAVLALNNPPLLSLGIPLALGCMKRRGWRAGGWALGSMCLMVLLFVGMESMVNGVSIWTWFRDYAHAWASATHFFEPSTMATAVISLLGFGVVAPFDRLGPTAELRDAARYLTSLPRLIAVMVYVGYLAAGCRAAMCACGRALEGLLQGLMVWMVVMVAFYVYFNPAEAILYSPQLTGAITLLVLAAHEGSTVWFARWATPAFVALVAWNNLRPFLTQ